MHRTVGLERWHDLKSGCLVLQHILPLHLDQGHSDGANDSVVSCGCPSPKPLDASVTVGWWPCNNVKMLERPSTTRAGCLFLACLQGNLEPWPILGPSLRTRLLGGLWCQWLMMLCTPGAVDHVLPTCQDGFAQMPRLLMHTWFHGWSPEFWLLWLIDSRMCLWDWPPH